jgi:hypothetical protein
MSIQVAKELHIGFQVIRIQLLLKILVDMVVPDMAPDMIAGILASWVCPVCCQLL